MVDDEKELNATRRAALEAAGNVRLVDIRSVYERLFLSPDIEEIPQAYQELDSCELRLYSYATFRKVFAGNARLLMWLLWDYDQLLYLDPDTVLRGGGPVNELFDSCR